MTIPNIQGIDFKEKRVILRADLDVPVVEGKVREEWRLGLILPTLSHILDQGAKQVLIIGHMGRPEGKVDEQFSLSPLLEYFKERITPDAEFVGHQPFDLYFEIQEKILGSQTRLVLLENLRFWPEEESNSESFSEQLAYGMDMYVNDAFGSSHRSHASIVGITKFLPAYLGLQFEKEIENLGSVFENPTRPVVALINGVKKDKLDYIEGFKAFCDHILIGGRLPEFLPEDFEDPKLTIAKLNPDKEDITIHSIESFERKVAEAKTIIVSGPIGKYEDPGHRLGTKRVFEAIAKADAYTVAGGGDTIAAINTLNLVKNFDWISAGGGAALEFLVHKTLPGIEAIIAKND